jgi:hypothetical protein
LAPKTPYSPVGLSPWFITAPAGAAMFLTVLLIEHKVPFLSKKKLRKLQDRHASLSESVNQPERGIMVHLPRAEESANRAVDANAVTTEIRSSICGKLNELSRGGNDLLKRMLISSGYDGVEGQFNQWSKRCEEYLSESLGATALKLFHSPASGMLYNPMRTTTAMMDDHWNYRSHLYDRISSRVTRLCDIARMVESGEIEPC